MGFAVGFGIFLVLMAVLVIFVVRFAIQVGRKRLPPGQPNHSNVRDEEPPTENRPGPPDGAGPGPPDGAGPGPAGGAGPGTPSGAS